MTDRNEYAQFTLMPQESIRAPRRSVVRTERFYTGTVLFLLALDFAVGFVLGGMLVRFL